MADELRSFAFEAVRPEDGLIIGIQLLDFRWLSATRLEVVAGKSSVVLTLPPQHVGEETQEYDPANADAPPHAGLFEARLAAATRLVFSELPAKRLEPISLDGILLLCESGKLVSPHTKGEPTAAQSRIEIPYRMLLAAGNQPWRLSAKPLTAGGFQQYELWTGGPRGGARLLPAFSVQEPDNTFANKTPMMASHRDGIVQSASAPVRAENFFLTPLGASLELDANFGEGKPILRWQHIATLGRDQFVRIVEAGYLYPTGHKAMHITLSRRRVALRNGVPVAYLEKQYFVALRQRDLKLAVPQDAEPTPDNADVETRKRRAARSLGLSELVSKVDSSPPLDPRSRDEITGVARSDPNGTRFVRWVRIRGEHFRFPMECADVDGTRITVPVPVLFVDHYSNADPITMADVRRIYNEATPNATLARTWRLEGQRVALAKSVPGKSAALPMSKWTLDVASINPASNALWGKAEASFHAILAQATTRLPDVDVVIAKTRDVATEAAALEQVGEDIRRTLTTLSQEVTGKLLELKALVDTLEKEVAVNLRGAMKQAANAIAEARTAVVSVTKYADLATASRGAWLSLDGATRNLQIAFDNTAGATKEQVSAALENAKLARDAIRSASDRLASFDANLAQAVNVALVQQLRQQLDFDKRIADLEREANNVVGSIREQLLAGRDALRKVKVEAEAALTRIESELQQQARNATAALNQNVAEALRLRDEARKRASAELTKLKAAGEAAMAEAASSLAPLGSLRSLPKQVDENVAAIVRDVTGLADSARHHMDEVREIADELRGVASGLKAKLPADYLAHGFDPVKNAKGTFLEILDELPVSFDVSRVGGLVEPNLAIRGFSRALGPLSGTAASLFKNTFDPRDYFPSKAKILGIVPLASVLNEVTQGLRDAMPGLERDGDQVTYTWETKELRAFGPFIPKLDGSSAKLSLKITAGLHDELSSTMVLSDFTLTLWGVIDVLVGRVKFDTRGQESPKIDVSIKDVQLGGQLAFFQKLQEKLKDITTFGGLSIQRAPGAVLRAAMRIQVPNLTMGMFSLTDLRFGADVDLSLRGEPLVVRFRVSERESPFTIAVAFLGGGGHLMLEATTAGIRRVEASLEFGATLAIDLGGLAYGRVKAMGGIEVAFSGGRAQITAYFTLAGHFRVIGIFSASLVFYLRLHYVNDGSLWGEATLTINIKIAFFSVKVELRATKSFAGQQRSALSALHASNGLLPDALAAKDTRARLAEVLPKEAFVRYRRAFHA